MTRIECTGVNHDTPPNARCNQQPPGSTTQNKYDWAVTLARGNQLIRNLLGFWCLAQGQHRAHNPPFQMLMQAFEAILPTVQNTLLMLVSYDGW